MIRLACGFLILLELLQLLVDSGISPFDRTDLLVRAVVIVDKNDVIYVRFLGSFSVDYIRGNLIVYDAREDKTEFKDFGGHF